MKVAVFSTKNYDQQFLDQANESRNHDLTYFQVPLNEATAGMAADYEAVCVFVNDSLHSRVLQRLSKHGIRLIVLRCAGFNNVDLQACHRLSLTVLRVPAYSPYSVAEHTVSMILSLNRKTHRAYARVREMNFALDGLLGFDLHRKRIGIVGTGRIGLALANVMTGFGCELCASDPCPDTTFEKLGGEYVTVERLFRTSDIISLHCPLTPDTHYLIDAAAIDRMKHGVMLINTSRGGLIDTRAVIDGLKSGRVGYLGLDVYEEEADLFFANLSDRVIQDDTFARLLTFPNVLITGHQAFFTREAMLSIAETTIGNITDFEQETIREENKVHTELYVPDKK